MPNIDVDVDVDDFLRSCSERDKEEIIEILTEDGYLDKKQDISNTNNNILDYEWQEILSNLENNRLRISNEDEETIKRISKKY